MGDRFQEKTLFSLREKYNDLQIVAGSAADTSGFTLLAVLRNEMYFLPEFLDHYRRLGIEKFVFLNDRSTDGSFEYLVQQPDTVIVESGRTYGDTFDIPQSLGRRIKRPRILYLWRAMLHDMFAPGDWAVQVDLDEFVRLPDGLTFPDIAERLERQRADAAWGVMLDLYPRDIAALLEHERTKALDASAPWYYDGEQHLRLRPGKAPKKTYSGARTRLYAAFEADRQYSRLGAKMRNHPVLKSMRKWAGIRSRGSNALHKTVLIKWSEDSYYRNSHETNRSGSKNILLPIQHFRFAGNLRQKLSMGLEEKSYHLGSADHRVLSELLQIMGEKNGSFLYRNSRPIGTFAAFAETRNAVWR